MAFTNLNFSNFCKARQYKWGVLVSGDFENQGRQKLKGDVKIILRENLTQKISNPTDVFGAQIFKSVSVLHRTASQGSFINRMIFYFRQDS